MISFELHETDGILELQPHSAMEADDFALIAAVVDPYIERVGGLQGLLIQASRFPGWANFSGLVEHLRFVRNHHREIRRVAFVSDDRLLTVAPDFARHFVRAQLRHFPADHYDEAMAWLMRNGQLGAA